MKWSRFLPVVGCLFLAAQSISGAVKEPTTLAEFTGTFANESSAPAEPLSLWYRRPAKVWTEALPIGNGRQGGMVFGGIQSEIVCLNESTLWGGGPYDPVNPEALAALPQVRQLVWDGKYTDAATLISQKVMAKPLKQQSYQPIGDLLLEFPDAPAAVSGYRRELNLKTAVTRVEYSAGGVKYQREMFASAPDNVLVLRLTADKPGALHFRVKMRSDQKQVAVTPETGVAVTLLRLTGNNDAGQGIPGALKFESSVAITANGPAVILGGEMEISQADSATLFIASATSYKNFNDVTADPAQAKVLASKAAAKGYEAIFKDHLADHQKLFDRVSLDLGKTDAAALPTDERIRNFAKGNDPSLAALYFQFGRYLLIGSSRPGGQPANLQGLWNDLTQPPWGSKYTININTEMNYWPAETANLAETMEPLMAMVEDLTVTGARTAKTMYNARGWVTHHNTDLWRATAPIDGPQYGMWPTGGAWLCNTLWEHYAFRNDAAFLKRLYPAMKGSVEFFLDTLVEDPKHKWLVTNPSLSPENRHPFGTSVAAGPTMDMQIIRDLFAHFIRAGEILGSDEPLRKRAAAARARLAPNQVGKEGQLQEWLDDWDTMAGVDQHHRHVSHLYGFFPGDDIPFSERTLAAAVRKSLELRGDNATGWGLGWRLNLWARLHDGPHAYTILQNLLHPDRTYPDMFDAHPPFQIDGNFGGAAGIVEMLMQSLAPAPGNVAEIEFLPALPPQWPTGSVRGIRARGGYEVDFAWADGKLASATVRNISGDGSVKLRHGERLMEVSVKRGEAVKVGAELR